MKDDNTMISKYQYPSTVTKFKAGKEISKTVVTENVIGTKELKSLSPDLNKVIDRLGDKEPKPRRESTNTSKMFPDKNIWRMMFQLGKY